MERDDNDERFVARRDDGEDGARRRPRRHIPDDAPWPDEATVYRGRVERLAAFGAFVSLEGFQREGLLHSSQASTIPGAKVEDVVAAGQTVFVKVLAVDKAAGRISLSMRRVRQSDGHDEDPMNVEGERAARAGRRRPAGADGEGGGGEGGEADDISGAGGGGRGITLGAVYNVACTRCGVVGHLAMNCFNPAGGPKYGLITAADMEWTRPKPPPAPPAAAAAPLPPAVHAHRPPLPPAGRGMAATLPAWMTQGPGPAGRSGGASGVVPGARGGADTEVPRRSHRARSHSSGGSGSDRDSGGGDRERRHRHRRRHRDERSGSEGEGRREHHHHHHRRHHSRHHRSRSPRERTDDRAGDLAGEDRERDRHSSSRHHGSRGEHRHRDHSDGGGDRERRRSTRSRSRSRSGDRERRHRHRHRSASPSLSPRREAPGRDDGARPPSTDDRERRSDRRSPPPPPRGGSGGGIGRGEWGGAGR